MTILEQEKREKPLKIGVYFSLAVAFGVIFFFFQELLQTIIIPPTHWLARCRSVLYDVGQAANMIAATLACSLFWWRARKKEAKTILGVLWNAYICSWIGFLAYVARMPWYVIHFSPCSALYSPGPARHMMGSLAYLIGGFELLIEASLWALACAALLYGYSGLIKKIGLPSCTN
jgi:hypothetical protein